MNIPIQVSDDVIAELCQRHRIQRMGLFGSVLRPDFTPESDVDVLVEFEPGAQTTYLDMVELQDELAAIFGRAVDVGTYDMLSPHIRDRVIGTERTIYEHR
jgi:predicted nucleotidyltransferase